MTATDPSLFHLVDEPSIDERESGPFKRPQIGIGCGVEMGEGLVGGETVLIMSVNNTSVTSDAGVRAPDAKIVSSPVVAAVVLISDPSIYMPVEIPFSTEEAEKGATGDDIELDSDVNPYEERMFDEGLIWVEVRSDGTSCLIVIPLDCNLMTSKGNIVPNPAPLCSSVEHRTLESFKDTNLSLSIFGWLYG